MPLVAAQAEYQEWFESALAEDERDGALDWKLIDQSIRYDHRVIRERLTELQAVRESGDIRSLAYYFDEGLHGNVAGIGSPGLYRRAKTGTKSLIHDYVHAMVAGLDYLATHEDPDFTLDERLSFFRRARQAFGSCALMLSGAGSLGPFHLGVAQALASQNLLPNVISGASAGSIVAAIVCTQDNEAVRARLSSNAILEGLEQVTDDEQVSDQGRIQGRINEDALRELVAGLIPDLTFAEASALSGRSLNISIAPSSLHQLSRTLNEVTSPNVLIREAVLASCAVPGVFPPVTLMARNARGQRVPYVKSRSWVDGSVTSDMPMKRLSRVHGCNFFIASQTNPMVRWAIGEPNSRNPVSQWVSIWQSASKEVVRQTYPLAMRLTRGVAPLNAATRMWYSVVTQDYTADVNILPRERFWNPTKLLAPLTPARAMELIENGRSSTWPHIERIRTCTAVSRRVDEAVVDLASRAER